jgi:hypothetical protein
LYLVLCFYLLPAFAIVLKIRSKKLAQVDAITSSTDIVNTSTGNLLFFDNFTVKISNVFLYRKAFLSDLNVTYSSLLFKNEAFYQFNLLMLNQFKIVTLFI